MKYIQINRIFVLTLMILMVQNLYSQKDTTESVDQYFTDVKDEGKSYNVLELKLSQLVFGEFEVSYERSVSNYFSVELGGSYILRNRLATINEIIDLGKNKFEADQDGYSYFGGVKYYFSPISPEGNYVGFRYKHFLYYDKNKAVKVNDYILYFGLDLVSKNNFVMEGVVGILLRSNYGTLPYAGLKVGFLF